jgi:hypothetical protein
MRPCHAGLATANGDARREAGHPTSTSNGMACGWPSSDVATAKPSNRHPQGVPIYTTGTDLQTGACFVDGRFFDTRNYLGKGYFSVAIRRLFWLQFKVGAWALFSVQRFTPASRL